MATDYKKLTDDLIRAKSTAVASTSGSDDGGTANRDTMVLRIPRAKEDKVLEAIKAAGLHCRGKSNWLGPGYFIYPPGGGQGNSRAKAVEAMAKSMESDGWKVHIYYQMD
ncbi:hypothetical protein [Acetonema longum]|uniref:Uncharacterized protein n=1 Tax=Acetonema longum DSM 6540 TaxID=1009370 RepID=F7NKC3_9FIRM|nr:hypothetical protein [Acetonema longum]EGO63564.1 hypothetical protein ALO_12681 [Acetonema longum DSM 6540]